MSALAPLAWLRSLAVLLAAAFLLCLTALWNGQPVFYPDTPTYLRGAEMGAARLLGADRLKPWLAPQAAVQPGQSPANAAPGAAPATPKGLTSVEDKVVLAGRSVYYGALVYAGHLAGQLWLTVALQALAVAYVLQLLMERLWRLPGAQVVGVAAVLGLMTPLGAYTGFLMPDVFASLVILIVGVLAIYWQALPRRHRWALSGLLLFGLCAHASHVVLAGLMLVLVLAMHGFSARWRSFAGAGLVVVAGCIGAAVAAEWAFAKAVTAAVGAAPLRLPHPMARLIDLGPGTAYLRQHCPKSGYVACAYLQNYPTTWDDFLFSTDPHKGTFALVDADTKRRLSEEQLRFVADVVRFDPLGVARGIGADVLHQLVNFRVDILRYSKSVLASYEGRVPGSVFADMQASRSARLSSPNHWLTVSSYAMVLAAVLVSVAWLRGPGARSRLSVAPGQRLFRDFAALVLAGLVANALVCAALASSMDRFQARVIWLVPFLALAALAQAFARRAAPPALQGGTSWPNPSPAAASIPAISSPLPFNPLPPKGSL